MTLPYNVSPLTIVDYIKEFFEAMPNPDYIKKVEIDNKVKVADLEAKVEAKTFKGNHRYRSSIRKKVLCVAA
jgi:hypothetical protein